MSWIMAIVIQAAWDKFPEFQAYWTSEEQVCWLEQFGVLYETMRREIETMTDCKHEPLRYADGSAVKLPSCILVSEQILKAYMYIPVLEDQSLKGIETLGKWAKEVAALEDRVLEAERDGMELVPSCT